MELIYALAGLAAGFIFGAWFACKRVNQGAKPTMASVLRGGGGGGPGPVK